MIKKIKLSGNQQTDEVYICVHVTTCTDSSFMQEQCISNRQQGRRVSDKPALSRAIIHIRQTVPLGAPNLHLIKEYDQYFFMTCIYYFFMYLKGGVWVWNIFQVKSFGYKLQPLLQEKKIDKSC